MGRELMLAAISSYYKEIKEIACEYAKNPINEKRGIFLAGLSALQGWINNGDYKAALMEIDDEGLVKYRDMVGDLLARMGINQLPQYPNTGSHPLRYVTQHIVGGGG